MDNVRLLLGDEAIALGAIHAGLSGVYAYPGTPSTEITEFIQADPLARSRGVRSPPPPEPISRIRQARLGGGSNAPPAAST